MNLDRAAGLAAFKEEKEESQEDSTARMKREKGKVESKNASSASKDSGQFDLQKDLKVKQEPVEPDRANNEEHGKSGSFGKFVFKGPNIAKAQAAAAKQKVVAKSTEEKAAKGMINIKLTNKVIPGANPLEMSKKKDVRAITPPVKKPVMFGKMRTSGKAEKKEEEKREVATEKSKPCKDIDKQNLLLMPTVKSIDEEKVREMKEVAIEVTESIVTPVVPPISVSTISKPTSSMASSGTSGLYNIFYGMAKKLEPQSVGKIPLPGLDIPLPTPKVPSPNVEMKTNSSQHVPLPENKSPLKVFEKVSIPLPLKITSSPLTTISQRNSQDLPAEPLKTEETATPEPKALEEVCTYETLVGETKEELPTRQQAETKAGVPKDTTLEDKLQGKEVSPPGENREASSDVAAESLSTKEIVDQSGKVVFFVWRTTTD